MLDEARSRQRLQDVVGSDYRVTRLIGRGGFAEVFEADDVRLGRQVAIKVVRTDLSVSPEHVERFQREARAMAGLRHPNVMDVYTVGERDGVAYFVMPLVVGETLKARIEKSGPLPLQEVQRILTEAAGALDAAHRAGIVHRDVKPENILMEGGSGRVLIADFGIAKAWEEDAGALTTEAAFVGTPMYMSPEQAAGDVIDHRSDVYSLGIVAYEMLTGRPPFVARTAQAMAAKHLTEAPTPVALLRRDCPARLALVIERSLAKDPGERWEGMGEALAVLRGELDPGGVPSVTTRLEGQNRLASDAPDQAPREDGVASYRRTAAIGGAALVGLVTVDVLVGLGGSSLWLALLGVGYLAVRAGRLWSAGHEWTEIVGWRGERDADPERNPAVGAQREAFGRLGSIVHRSTADRAAILNAFAGLPRQEQQRFPRLRDVVDELAARVKHQARKIVTLEERIAEAAAAADQVPGTAEAAAELAGMAAARRAARVDELNLARNAASAEMRACLTGLEELRDVLTERFRLDAARAIDDLARVVSEAGAALEHRAR